MTDYNTQALNQYQRNFDAAVDAEEAREECEKRAIEYFAATMEKVDGANLETEFFSIGGKQTYSLLELMADELGTKNRDLDRMFFDMLETEQGAKFKAELSRLLGIKHPEMGEVKGDDY